MKLLEVLNKYNIDDPSLISFGYNIKKVNVEKRLVTGQIYAPNCLDSHGHFMSPEELEKVAHEFLRKGLQGNIDVMHDNELVDACLVESWIARGHPLYEEGAWIGTTKINDDAVWQQVKKGNLNGYSFEILTFRNDVSVEIEYQSWYYGFTDPDPIDKHTHAFLIKMDNNGNVLGGETSATDGHVHKITRTNVTEKTDRHSHRIHLEKS